MFEELQSDYKAHHSTETTLVKVFKDIMLKVDSGSGSCYVLYLSVIWVYIWYCIEIIWHSGRSQAVIVD